MNEASCWTENDLNVFNVISSSSSAQLSMNKRPQVEIKTHDVIVLQVEAAGGTSEQPDPDDAGRTRTHCGGEYMRDRQTDRHVQNVFHFENIIIILLPERFAMLQRLHTWQPDVAGLLSWQQRC